MEDVRYPIGKFSPIDNANEEQINSFINQLERQPVIARQSIEGLSEEQIGTPYRPEGWTVRQVIHHIADANINAYSRFKIALTEDEPTIKLWDEVTWAELEDSRKAPVELSLAILDAIHARWSILLRSLRIADFKRKLIHPQMGKMALSDCIQFYVWHGNHHVAQVQSFRDRMHW